MNYYVELRGNEKNTADVKAPSDMCEIMHEKGYIPIKFKRPKYRGRLFAFFTNLRNWLITYFVLNKGDVLVYQYPLLLSHFSVNMLIRLFEKKSICTVLLIHDVDSIRGYNSVTNEWKEKLFLHTSYIICHNNKMKEWLINYGVEENRIISLGVFDYLTDDSVTFDYNDNNQSIIIAGNLSNQKSSYVGELLKSNHSYIINLYGPNFVKDKEYQKYTYYGSFPPDKLVSNLRGQYGLVWDGDSLNECSGMTGNYLKYNNPHKVSLYIASGLPVIIWKKAALAEYIEKNHLGFSISDLTEIDNILNTTSLEKYKKLFDNVQEESKKLRKGYYLNRALDEINDKGY